jgi:hypothetical protein
MYAKDEHVRPGDRAALVDEVMDLPEVKASNRVEATVPFGDAESVERLRERTDDATLRAAGSTTLLDANVPPNDGYQPDARPRPLPGWVSSWAPAYSQGAKDKGAKEYDDSDDQQVQQAFSDHADNTQHDRCDH